MPLNQHNWLDLQHHPATGIDTVRAHFTGHAYDPHWHDEYLIGTTQAGVQQFRCRREKHASQPGRVFMLEPGEIHDGDAPCAEGFTYLSLYLPPHWLQRETCALFEAAPASDELGFQRTLVTNPVLARRVLTAFAALDEAAPKLVCQAALDALLDGMTAHLAWRARYQPAVRNTPVALRTRDYLHQHYHDDIDLDTLTRLTGTDRFRLTRAFKAEYGLPPHAYLVQLRLAEARKRLAAGERVADVAATVGFSDQSHLGRWFRRAYGLTPADYRRRHRLQ